MSALSVLHDIDFTNPSKIEVVLSGFFGDIKVRPLTFFIFFLVVNTFFASLILTQKKTFFVGPQNKLVHKLKHLGFSVEDCWTTESHILVTNRAMASEKYKKAADDYKPIVHRQWIDDSFAQSSPLPLERYLLPALKGLNICVSQISKDERQKIARLAKEHGAKYDPSLTSTIHYLILEEPRGEKFEFAKRLLRSRPLE